MQENGDDTLVDILEVNVSEIFLFFDYDFQESRLTLEENNRHIGEMLEYFNDETENGKLYINYPMVESVFYTKQLPDKDYLSYYVTREECHNFKPDADGGRRDLQPELFLKPWTELLPILYSYAIL